MNHFEQQSPPALREITKEEIMSTGLSKDYLQEVTSLARNLKKFGLEKCIEMTEGWELPLYEEHFSDYKNVVTKKNKEQVASFDDKIREFRIWFAENRATLQEDDFKSHLQMIARAVRPEMDLFN